mgnify:CR=1 FL=1
MKTIIPYIYLLVGITFIIKGLYALFNEQEIYYLIFSLETKSKMVYILFNGLFGALILYSGLGRLKGMKKQ